MELKPRKVKRPLFNHTKIACLICRDKNFDKESTELSPDWYSYLCVDCMNEHNKLWNREFE